MSFEEPHITRETNPERFERRGKNVHEKIKFQRHGLREGTVLTEDGRKMTRERAEQTEWQVVNEEGVGYFNAAKATGSPADTPKKTVENPNPLSRALETADITARTVAGKKAGTWHPRPEERLNHKHVVTPPPYEHLPIYDKALEEAIRDLNNGKVTLGDLTKDEKVKVTEQAQNIVAQHVSSLNTPEADVWKTEVAGMFADLIEHHINMTHYLDNDSKVLYVAGTHGPTIEILLQKALIWTDSSGNVKTGYQNPDEIGGPFQSSDAYNVDLKTDDQGKLQDILVTFDDPKRTQLVKDAHFDLKVLETLAQKYRDMHHSKNNL